MPQAVVWRESCLGGLVLPGPAGERNPMRRSTWLLLLIGLASSLVLFAPAFDNPLRDDDLVFLGHVIAHPGLRDLLRPSPSFAFYRPGALLLFRLEYGLLGLAGGHYLVVNYLLHVSIAIVLLGLLRAIRVHETAAALGTALFLVGFGHYAKQPMWACTSGPMASALLCLLAIRFALRRTEVPDAASHPRRALAWSAAMLGALSLAPLFHEAGLVAPLLLLPILWPRGEKATGRGILVAFSALPALAWTLTLLALSRHYPAYRGAAPQILRVPVYLFRYLGFMLLPIQKSQLALTPYLQAGLSGAVVVASAGLVRRGPRSARLLVLWLYAALLPFCLIALPDGWLEMRYLYFAAAPACGLAGMLAATLHEKSRTAGRQLVVASACAVVIATLAFELVLEHKYDRYARQPQNLGELQILAREAQVAP